MLHRCGFGTAPVDIWSSLCGTKQRAFQREALREPDTLREAVDAVRDLQISRAPNARCEERHNAHKMLQALLFVTSRNLKSRYNAN
jgi:hypothetical protein